MKKEDKRFHNFVDFPLLIQIGLVVLLLAFILDLIGFAAPYWNVDEATFSGLWQKCTSDGNGTFCGSLESNTSQGWLVAVQILKVFGILGLLGAVVILVLFLFIWRGLTKLHIAAMSCCFAAGLLGILGAIIYGSSSTMPGSLGFAFALSLCGGVLSISVGVLLVLDYFQILVK